MTLGWREEQGGRKPALVSDGKANSTTNPPAAGSGVLDIVPRGQVGLKVLD